MTAQPVVTQLNTQEVVVWEPHRTLFICLQVCAHECVCMSVSVYMWEYDTYSVHRLKCLSFVCAFVYVCMSRVHTYVCVSVHKCVCLRVCVCGVAAPSGLACVYLGLIPDLHHFSADSSIPPSLCPSGYLQVYRRLPFPACQHPILFLPCLLSSLLLSSPRTPICFHTDIICFISDCVLVLSLKNPSLPHSSSSQTD